MSDEIDAGQETDQFFLNVAIKNAAKDIPIGEPGECIGCGEWFVRTVGGYCGRCRDEFKIA